MKLYLADRQDITRAGLIYIINGITGTDFKYTEDKTELIAALKEESDTVVIFDYTLFDINDADELGILHERFPKTRWLLFSDDLSVDFVKSIIAMGSCFSILLKESPMAEIREAISFAMQGSRYICQRMTETLLLPRNNLFEEKVKLTKTETEILKDIALGMTTREIAEKRVSSFHTINTHRKNIFRKLEVNNAHEATKYALRAGLIDAAEYYI